MKIGPFGVDEIVESVFEVLFFVKGNTSDLVLTQKLGKMEIYCLSMVVAEEPNDFQEWLVIFTPFGLVWLRRFHPSEHSSMISRIH